MKCMACGERLYAADMRSRTDSNGGTVPMPPTKHAVVIIERLRSIGKASETPTLGDLRRALGNISGLPDDAELSLQISGVLDPFSRTQTRKGSGSIRPTERVDHLERVTHGA
jgi:hypothetical protein